MWAAFSQLIIAWSKAPCWNARKPWSRYSSGEERCSAARELAKAGSGDSTKSGPILNNNKTNGTDGPHRKRCREGYMIRITAGAERFGRGHVPIVPVPSDVMRSFA